MAPKKPRGGDGGGDGGTPQKNKPPQKFGGIDASSSVSKAQDATQAAAKGGRATSNGDSSTNPTGNTPPKTDPPPTDPPKPGKDDTPLNEKSDDPQNPARDAGNRNTEGDPIDIATGEMIQQQTDVELPGALPLVLNRTHLSSYRVGLRFGASWASTLDQRLEVGSAGVSFAAEDGKLLLAPTPAVGATVRFAKSRHELTRNEDGGFTLTEFDSGRKLFFAPSNEMLPLAAIVDRNGHRIDFDYDETGTPIEVRHSGGYRIRVDSEDGLVTGMHLCEADNGDDVLLMRYVYENRRLVEVINGSGLPMRFSYDSAGRITSWVDRNDEWYRFTYDHKGRVVAADGSGGFLSGTMEYDSENRVTHWTNSQGARTTYHLNESGQTIRSIDPLGGETWSEWDDYDRLSSRTDPLGRTTSYGYDQNGNLIAITRPDGSQTRFEYNELRLPVAIIAPDGTMSRREYDERGNLIRAIDPAGAVTSYVYDEHGHMTSNTDALGNVRRVETDAAGLPVTLTDSLGGTTRYVRDGFGRVVEMIDPLGGSTRLGWNVDGKLAWRTLPDGATERWLYDGEGNLRTHIDALGQETRTEVTHFDLPSLAIRPDGTRLQFDYDTELRLVSVTNELGAVWRYDYDAAGNLVRETDFNGRVVAYAHDAAGQLIARTNGTGETTHFARDVFGNVIERRSGAGTSTFTYDPLGRLVEAMNADVQVTFRRDPAGRVLAETINGRTIASVYDTLGRRIRRRTPSGAETVWEYDANGRPTALQTSGRTFRFGYDSAGHEIQRELGPKAVLAQAWDANHQLLSQTITGASGLQLQRRAYTYRADGFLTELDDKLTGPRTFELDRAGRVTAVTGAGWIERYAYDAAGNLTQASWPTPSGADAEELGDREYSGTLIRRAGKVRYEHDAQGRVVLRQRKRLSRKPDTWRYFWDADDRLVEVLTPDGGRWRYRYDPLGRRVAKQRLTPDGSGVLEQLEFVWDATVLAEQAHTDGMPNGPNLGDARVTVWNYEPGTFRPLTQTERSNLRHAPQQWIDEEFYSIVTDIAGAPTELINDQGGIAWYHRTTLWGITAEQSRTGAYTPLRFPGQYADPETGFNYNFHRHYDPDTGRYGSTDPMGLSAGPNPHRYVSNPHMLIDPLGLSCRDIYRGMRDDNGAPMIGPTARTLGARPGTDIPVDDNGMVHPGTGGVSTAPDDPTNLPGHRRDSQFGGTGKDPVWEINTSQLPDGLTWRQDSGTHGNIEPSRSMPLEEYQGLLASTQGLWRRAQSE